MRILWLAPYSPWPPSHGGKIRCYNLAHGMLELGHAVEIWSISDEPAQWPSPPPPGLNLRSFKARPRHAKIDKIFALLDPLPEEAWSTRTEQVALALRTLPQGAFDVAVLEQAHLGGVAAWLRAAGIPWVLNTQNVESYLLRQLSARAETPITRLRLRLNAAKFARLEKALLRSASAVIAVSEEDRRRLLSLDGSRAISLHPNGVDVSYFDWSDHSQSRGATLLMTGTLGYRPNLDACRWLAGSVLPEIRQLLPNASVLLVGGGVVPAVQALDNPAAGFRVVGPVPDVRPYFKQADAFIIPLRMGSGTRLKALEALASGLPLVGTRLAVEGLGLLERNLALTGDSASELAQAAVTALTDTAARSRLSREGRAYVERHFDWKMIAEGFEKTLAGTAVTPAPSPVSPPPRAGEGKGGG